MYDHESALLLAAKRLSEPLTREEEAELEEHLASCPSCRTIAVGMRRDDMRLHAALAPTPVAPRVRQRVLAEAKGSRSAATAGRIGLLLAAGLGVGVLAVPFLTGGSPGPAATDPARPSPTSTLESPSPSDSPTPTASTRSSPSPSGNASTSPSASAGPNLAGQSVNGSFVYSEAIPKRGGISAHFVEGRPQGAWSRRVPATGDSQLWKGTISCLVVSGNQAWMAGPVTESPDDTDAIFILVRDAGAQGEGDRAMMWLNQHGETLELLEGWCRDKFRPGSPYPLSSGDIEVHGGG